MDFTADEDCEKENNPGIHENTNVETVHRRVTGIKSNNDGIDVEKKHRTTKIKSNNDAINVNPKHNRNYIKTNNDEIKLDQNHHKNNVGVDMETNHDPINIDQKYYRKYIDIETNDDPINLDQKYKNNIDIDFKVDEINVDQNPNIRIVDIENNRDSKQLYTENNDNKTNVNKPKRSTHSDVYKCNVCNKFEKSNSQCSYLNSNSESSSHLKIEENVRNLKPL